LSLVDRIIEAFQDLNGDRSISEIENWVTKKYGARWKRNSFSTSMADMVSKRFGGNSSSGVQSRKRVLRRVRPGVYCLISWESPSMPKRQKVNRPMIVSKVLNVSVKGTPAPWANSGETKWKNDMRRQVPDAGNASGLKGLVMEFGYRGRGDLDNLCEPVFSVVVNEKGWFGGRRSNIEWWIASKESKRPGCKIVASSDESPQVDFGKVVFEGKYNGPLPRRAKNESMLDWMKISHVVKPVGNMVGVELGFEGYGINLGDISTGPVKSCIDCLQPILGGPEGNPDDGRISDLLVKRVNGNRKGVMIRVYSK
jgi:hypothetical protein